MVLFANELLGDYRHKYEAEMDAARKYHGARQREMEEANRVAEAGGGHSSDQDAGVAHEAVDPESELIEVLMRKYGAEIAESRARPDNERGAEVVRALMASGSQFMGGGR